MNTAIISGYGGLEKIEYITTKKLRIKTNEVLIQVKAFALNPKDILVRKGKFKYFSEKKFPQLIGFEFSGVVLKSSSRSKFKAKDKVLGLFNGFKGQCSAPYISVKESLICHMPNNLSFDQACGVSLVGLTSLQAFRDLGLIKPSFQVCINGASGGVGTWQYS